MSEFELMMWMCFIMSLTKKNADSMGYQHHIALISLIGISWEYMTHGDLGLADNRGSSQVAPTVHGRIIPIEVVEQYQPYLSEKYESVGIIIPNIWKNKKSKPPAIYAISRWDNSWRTSWPSELLTTYDSWDDPSGFSMAFPQSCLLEARSTNSVTGCRTGGWPSSYSGQSSFSGSGYFVNIILRWAMEL